MNKFVLITYIFQLVSGLTLIGISVFYFISGNRINGFVFLGVGAVFVVIPIKNFFTARKQKREEKEKASRPERHDFIR